MSIFKHNLKRMSTALILAVLLSLISGLVVPQAVLAQEDGGFLSALKDFFTTSTENEASFPVAEIRVPRKTIWVIVTAYSSTVDQCDSTPCITANCFDLCKAYAERELADKIAANFIKFGTQVRLPDIDSNKIYIVRDRMNTKYNGQNRIDVWMPTRELAQNFGVKRVKMEIF